MSQAWQYPKGRRNKDWSGTTQPLPFEEPKPKPKKKVQKQAQRAKGKKERRAGGYIGTVGPETLPMVEPWHKDTPPWLDKPPDEVLAARRKACEIAYELLCEILWHDPPTGEPVDTELRSLAEEMRLRSLA